MVRAAEEGERPQRHPRELEADERLLPPVVVTEDRVEDGVVGLCAHRRSSCGPRGRTRRDQKIAAMTTWAIRIMADRSAGSIRPRASTASRMSDGDGHEKGGRPADLQLVRVVAEHLEHDPHRAGLVHPVVGRVEPGRPVVGPDRPPDDLVDHAANRLGLGVVEGLGGVVRRVVERVLAGREEQEGDLTRPERAVVAPIHHQEVGAEHPDPERLPRAGLANPRPARRPPLRPHDEDEVGAHPGEGAPDHVGRDEQRDLAERHRRVLDEVSRPEQPPLLQVESDEHHAPPRPLRRLDEAARH